ncbi:uncharacterized protein VP01_335g16 [Puccinia sorghi]|uniref:Myb/SANT-like domain-containing protein n=1 Tax=Puccinia sorghi TaxID=27349 RepID=A0A0L6UXU4_9BASI|nr:uncharacterized protein VP01_335g16 [Puccinia sorghi]
MAQPSSTNQSSSGPMEMMMLDLYAEEVSKGRKADSGFQTSSHWHVAQELCKHFPEVEHVLDANKVKSKLSQGFKKDYDTFLACKDASGFGWDEISCEVTALDAVWDKFLLSHPNAKQFQGTTFPEFQKLGIIFVKQTIWRPKDLPAMALYQEVHAPHASKEDSLATFKIFHNNINTQIFTSITDDGLCTAWLQEKIQESTQLYNSH